MPLDSSSSAHFWTCNKQIICTRDGGVLYLSLYSTLMYDDLDSSKYLDVKIMSERVTTIFDKNNL